MIRQVYLRLVVAISSKPITLSSDVACYLFISLTQLNDHTDPIHNYSSKQYCISHKEQLQNMFHCAAITLKGHK